MSVRRRSLPPGFGHAARVALATTLFIGIVYGGCVTVVDRVVTARIVGAVDARLRDSLSDARQAGQPLSVSSATDYDDMDDPPVYLWTIPHGRSAVSLVAGSPRLPAAAVLAGRPSQTVQLPPGTFRVDSVRDGGSLLVAGQSLAEQDHIEAVLGMGEMLAAPVLLLAVLAGALIIGLRALSPVEQSRRRQLEFTADASHELRTPLSVIAAETSLALDAPPGAPRKTADYRAALTRIQGESERLRSIVENLLWLARFDSQPPPPSAEPLDLATIARGCADRFGAVAHSQSTMITVVDASPGHAWISAPGEWIDRLAGVLADNACRYAGPEGQVRISVDQRAGRVTLTVEDSGPGIPASARDRLFDRFHRATAQGSGAGLGLAIADSIVRSTAGQWRIGDSPLGGALLSVSWRRAGLRQPGTQASAPAPAAAAEDPVTAGHRRHAAAASPPRWPGRRRD
jgi:signal transduction histidine kinase